MFAGISWSLRSMCPNNLHRASLIVTEMGLSLVFLYSDSLVIFVGHLIPSSLFSCFRWNASSFSSSVFVTPQVPQLYNKIGFTSDLYSFNLVES